jgi:hypothetical protein
MNFATPEKMISEGDLRCQAFRYLLECRGECEWLDYAELCAFARNILAFKNVGGGYIAVGVRDKTRQ